MAKRRPFGKINYENITTNLSNDYTFTGQEYDEENSLQYYGARYMDNEIGKFISIDPLMIDILNAHKYNKDMTVLLGNSQELNSYAYAVNNPIIYTDPTGESSSLYQPFSSLHRINNQTNGYVARNINASINQIKNASIATAATLSIPAAVMLSYEVGLPATVAALTNPATLGAAVNVAERSYWDYQDNGTIDDGASKYLGSAAFGAITGRVLQGANILNTAIMSGVFEAGEEMAFEHEVNPSSVLGNALGSGLAKGIFAQPATQAIGSLADVGFTKLSEAVTEFAATVVSTDMFRNIFNRNKD